MSDFFFIIAMLGGIAFLTGVLASNILALGAGVTVFALAMWIFHRLNPAA